MPRAGEGDDVAEQLLVLMMRSATVRSPHGPGAWQGQNVRRVTKAVGIDVDAPWRDLSRKDRDWLLYTDEQPRVLIDRRGEADDTTGRDYHGTFWSARKHVRHTLADTKSQMMRDKAMRFVRSTVCPVCGGTGLQPASLAVTFRGLSIAETNTLSFVELVDLLRPVAELAEPRRPRRCGEVAVRRPDLLERVEVLLDLGLGYLALGRSSTTLSPGEAQRLRIATQLRSALRGGLRARRALGGPAPGRRGAVLDVLDRLKTSGNSLFVVEHDLDVVRRADWIVDIGPGAGEAGGRALYSGPVDGLEQVEESVTGAHLFGRVAPLERHGRTPHGWLHLRGVRGTTFSTFVDLPRAR